MSELQYIIDPDWSARAARSLSDLGVSPISVFADPSGGVVLGSNSDGYKIVILSNDGGAITTFAYTQMHNAKMRFNLEIDKNIQRLI